MYVIMRIIVSCRAPRIYRRGGTPFRSLTFTVSNSLPINATLGVLSPSLGHMMYAYPHLLSISPQLNVMNARLDRDAAVPQKASSARLVHAGKKKVNIQHVSTRSGRTILCVHPWLPFLSLPLTLYPPSYPPFAVSSCSYGGLKPPTKRSYQDEEESRCNDGNVCPSTTWR